MKVFKPHFLLNKSQRNGVLLLSVLVLAGLVWYSLIDFKNEFSLKNDEAVFFQEKIDSLKAEKLSQKRDTIYPFNPNFITDYKGYRLGMSLEEIDRLHAYRAKNKWVNSTNDFKRVTQISDSLLKKISPYFKFPEWVTQPKKKNSVTFIKNKKALNSATLQDFITIEGVTRQHAHEILKYKKKLGGFIEDNQLFEVYNLPKSLVYKIKDGFTVKKPANIDKLNVNAATASDLATVPYINFDLARNIIDYRTLHEGIESIDEIKKIEGMTTYKFQRIKLYLYTNNN